MQKLPVTLFTLGCATLIIVLIFGWVVIPQTVLSNIENEMSLTNGSILWDEWRSPDHESYYKVYFFNVTNPKEIESGGEPVVEQLGPYVYREIKSRKILEENSDNGTLRYIKGSTFIFDENLSIGTENDTMTLINVVFLGVVQYLATYAATFGWLASVYLAKFQSTVFVQRTVKEFLFTGTYEPMIAEIEKLSDRVIFPNSTFGLFYGKNGTDLEEFEVHSGIKDNSRLGEIISWNGKSELKFWTGAGCNMINGTDGTLFSPFVTKEQTIQIFRPEICRSIYFKYENDVEVKGIPSYRFSVPPSVLQDGNDNPDNQCFCSEKDVSKCPKSGVYQISACQNDAPILVSSPQFLNGDPQYAKKFGFNPKKELHETLVDLEPETGMLLRFHGRFQLNVDVKRLPKNYKFKFIQDLVFPLIWIDESYVISDDGAAKIKYSFITSLGIINSVKWCAFVLSVVLIIISITIFWIRIRRKPVFV